MSVLIKGMNMPETCIDCNLTYCDDDFGTSCCFTGVPCLNLGRQAACPLVEIPTPHGRLIDADDIENITVCKNIHGVLTKIEAPTIIEAEE